MANAMFWGCTIPARFPYLEKSMRIMLDKLGQPAIDIEGFACCPERSLVKTLDPRIWYMAAARNLAVAEQAGYDILTPCTGCHSTLKNARASILTDPELFTWINRQLSAFDLQFSGKTKVKHIVEWLVEDYGDKVLASKISHPLWGVKIAVHPGCHMVRPSPAVRWDDSIKPMKFDLLVTASGATTVSYPSKYFCCGSTQARHGHQEGSLNIAHRKLKEISENEADAMVTACPSCFQQFDLNQAILKKQQKVTDVPVIYISDLVSLAFGEDPRELGFSQHRTPVDPLIETLKTKKAFRAQLSESFDIKALERCAGCRACRHDCTVAKVDQSFDPTALIVDLLENGVDAMVENPGIWKCLECDLCYELCPTKQGMEDTFRSLKRIAIKRGLQPQSVKQAASAYLKTGNLGEPRQSSRAELGLPDLPPSGGKQMTEILERIGIIIESDKK